MKIELGQKIIDKIRGKKKKVINIQPQLPSDCERIQIDSKTNAIRYYVYDYQNIANTIVNDKKVLFIDIGANEAQSARYAYKFFKNVTVVSYEPLKSCLHFLDEVKEEHPDYIYKDIALSKEVGTITIKENVAISGLSSSLDIKSDYPYFDAENKYKQSEVINHEVKTSTITEEAKWWKTFDTDLKILKIDTQGTELEILKAAGGGNLLKEGFIDILMIEIITADKYVGQGNYIDTINFLNECGFEIYNIKPGFRTYKNNPIAPEGLSYGMGDEYDFTYIHKNTLSKLKKNNEI